MKIVFSFHDLFILHTQFTFCRLLLDYFASDMGKFAKENFEEFCGSTSLHACNRLPSSSSAIRKSYWILVICGSLLLGSYFVFENVDIFLKAHSTSSVDTTTGPLSNGRFPKISICNSYKVRQSFLDTVFNKSVITDDESGYDMPYH